MALKYLFKVNHNNTRTKYASMKYQFNIDHNNTRTKYGPIVLISLLLTLTRYCKLLFNVNGKGDVK